MTVLRPHVGDTTNPTGGKIGRATSNDFVIQLIRLRGRYRLHRWDDETGAGDDNVMLNHNALARGTYTLIGLMMEGAIGLANLTNRQRNPATNVTFLLSPGRKQTVNILIEEIAFDWQHTGVNVPIVMTCHVTDTSTSAVEGT